jgi:5-methylcytosine-specific restriction endonuclease McrA
MPTGWQGSTRRATLPKDWWRVRWAVLQRDQHRCRIQLPDICIGTATEVDHAGDRHDHSNLRAACKPCHQHRSSQQGGVADGARRRARMASRKRPPERHPGLRT